MSNSRFQRNTVRDRASHRESNLVRFNLPDSQMKSISTDRETILFTKPYLSCLTPDDKVKLINAGDENEKEDSKSSHYIINSNKNEHHP